MEVETLKHWPRNRLLVIPVLLVLILLLTACPAPTDVAVGEVVENLLSEAQRRQFPRETFEQSLSDALAGLHQADENLEGLAAPPPE